MWIVLLAGRGSLDGVTVKSSDTLIKGEGDVEAIDLAIKSR